MAKEIMKCLLLLLEPEMKEEIFILLEDLCPRKFNDGVAHKYTVRRKMFGQFNKWYVSAKKSNVFCDIIEFLCWPVNYR